MDPSSHEHAEHADGSGSAECLLCPLCALLQALTSARPEVTEHLLAAARELALAFAAAADGHGESLTRARQRSSEGLQRIKID